MHPPDIDQPDIQTIIEKLRDGAFAEARRKIEGLLENHPNDPLLHNLLGSAWTGLGQRDKAKSYVERAVALDPHYANAHHNLGVMSLQDGDARSALHHFERAHELAPSDPALISSLATARFGMRDFQGALQVVEVGLQQAPDDLDLLISRAEYLLSCRQFRKAAESFRQVLKRDPENGFLKLSLARALSRLGDTAEAVEKLKEAAQLLPENHEVYLELGRIWHQHEKFDRARETFEHAARLAPKDPVVFSELGKTAFATGQRKTALRHYQKSLSLDPGNTETRHFVNALSGQTSGRAPQEYVANLFDAYAEGFEKSLTGDLGYDAFRSARDLALDHTPKRWFGSVMDLGCGTGLFGQEIRPNCGHLSGVDLSARMIALARDRGIYDQLDKADILDTVKTQGADHDLFAAADVFVYLGDLTPVFEGFAKTARPGAMMVFTTEQHDGDGYDLRESGRFAHSRAYLDTAIGSAGLRMLHYRSLDLRRETGKMLTGGLCLVRKS